MLIEIYNLILWKIRYMGRLAVFAFLAVFLAGWALAYSGTSFSFAAGAGGNVNASFTLDVVANNTDYLGNCTDRLSANSASVLVNAGGGSYSTLSNYDISGLYNASGIAQVNLKITSLGTYNVSLSTSGCENVSAAASTLISLYGGNFSGYVWNATAGTAFSGAEVRLSGSYGNETAFASGAGYYSFANVPHASGYRIYVNASGYSLNESGSLTLLENESAVVNFTLYANQAGAIANSTIMGYVFNSTSSLGIQGISVRLQNSTANASNTTGAGGAYSFGGFYSGTYALWINATGFDYYSATVQLANGTNYLNVTLNETASGRVFGIVRNASNNATISNASIRAYKSGYSNSASTPSNGSYAFSYLAPGNYTIAINATSFTSRSLLFEIKNLSSSLEFNVSMFTNIIANLSNGLSCEIGEQCASSNCCGSLCTALDCNVPNGGRCSVKAECESGLFCCTGVCQTIECIALNVPAGGACNRPDQCQAGLLCCNGACKEGKCTSDVEVSLEKQEVVVLGFKRIEIERKLVSNKSSGIAEVFLTITNRDSERIDHFELRETVPGLAGGFQISGIEPAIYAMQNGSLESRVLVWRFLALEPGNSMIANYRIGKFIGTLEGFSSFGQRYEEVVVQKEKVARLIAPAKINVGEQVTITVKDLDGNPVANAGVIISAPNSQNMIVVTNDEGVAKYVATIEGEYSYSVEGWALIESVRKTGALRDYAEPANLTGEVKGGQFSLGGVELVSLGVAGVFVLFIGAGIVLALIILFYYIYLKK